MQIVPGLLTKIPRQAGRIMKLTTVFLLTACLQVSATGHSQNITISEKRAPLEKIFGAIEKQTGYTFWYKMELLQNAKPVDIDVKNAILEKVLQIVFKDQALTYNIVEKTIVVKERLSTWYETPDSKTTGATPSIDIHGRVVNEQGEPVVANITVKGKDFGTTSNDDGYFELKNVDENATLIITGVSIETRELKIGGNTDLVIVIKTAFKPLDAVVINKGYYSTTKRLNTGSVSKITAEEIEKQPVSNVLGAMEGRMPGLYISQISGTAGGSYIVQLRGQNSIASGNNPLYVVDGVPYTSTSLSASQTSDGIINGGNPLHLIASSDLESIEILKDADATAIYGSRGANGVILITTKKGKAGRTNVNVNVYSGFGKVASKIRLLDTKEYLNMRHEAFLNDGVVPQSYDYDITQWDTTRNTDWQKLLIGGTSHITEAQASVSGGSSNTQFMISGGYRKESTVFPGDFADHKINAHFNLNHVTSNSKLRVNLTGNFVSDFNDLLSLDLTNQALYLPPDAPAIYNPDGSLNWEGSTWTNPFSSLLQKYKGNSENLIMNGLISYHPVKGLQINLSGGYNSLAVDEIRTSPIAASDPAYFNYTKGYSFKSDNTLRSWILEPGVDYDLKLTDSRISLQIGSTFQQNIRKGETFFAYGFTDDAILENIRAAPTLITLDLQNTIYHYAALFGRVNYNLKEKYILNLTGRRDGSSRFGPGRQFANFGAAGVAWIFSKETWIQKGLSFFSYGKIRASYGSTGNDQIGDYQYLNTYSPTTYFYQGNLSTFPTSLFNPEYSWEVNRKFEAALESGFFKNHLLFNIAYYRNRSSNQLVGFSLPVITGQSSVQANLPATVQNSGVESDINIVAIQNKNFSWSTAINITIPRTKLIKYPRIESSSYADQYQVGKSLFIQKKYHYIGIDNTTGLYKFEDVNGDGDITYPEDLQALKTVEQKYYGGWLNTIKYKGIEASIFIQFVSQTGRNYMNTFGIPGTFANQPLYVINRWRKPGDQATVQRYTQDYSSAASSAYNNSSSYGDGIISDASFIRCKNISLSWQLPELWTRKLRFQFSKIFLQGQNLFTITGYKGLDPESLVTSYIPPLRIITAGVQITL